MCIIGGFTDDDDFLEKFLEQLANHINNHINKSCLYVLICHFTYSHCFRYSFTFLENTQMVNSRNSEYYSAIKKNGILPFAK